MSTANISKRTERTLKGLLRKVVPNNSKGRSELPHGELAKLAKAAGIVPDTIRRIHARESLSAVTLIRLLLAKGANEESIIHIPFTKPTKVCKHLSQWNDFGAKISPKQRKEFLSLCNYLLKEWNIKI